MLFAMMATASIASKTKDKTVAQALCQEDSPDPGCLQLVPPVDIVTAIPQVAFAHSDLTGGNVFSYEADNAVKIYCFNLFADDANPYNCSAILADRYEPAYSRGKNLRIRDWVMSAPSGRNKLNYLRNPLNRASAAYHF